MQTLFSDLIELMNAQAPLFLMGVEAMICFTAILFLLRFFGKTGLYAYISVAVIAANVQVLKIADLGLLPHPAALGTILFTSTYLCTLILAEYYGKKAAQKGVMIGFTSFALWTLFMLMTLGYQTDPLTSAQDQAMQILFLPTPTLLAAGMIAYLISQNIDVWLFSYLKTASKSRFLWLRNSVSTLISCLIDNIIFSVLAFMILTSTPLPFKTVLFSYILGTYIFRILMAIFDTPIIYLARFMRPTSDIHLQPQPIKA